jgi:hypothetical protein
MQSYLRLLCFALLCHNALSQEGGRNDGEPDYDGSDNFELRSGGQNDGEPDYEPGETLRSFEKGIDGKLLRLNL